MLITAVLFVFKGVDPRRQALWVSAQLTGSVRHELDSCERSGRPGAAGAGRALVSKESRAFDHKKQQARR